MIRLTYSRRRFGKIAVLMAAVAALVVPCTGAAQAGAARVAEVTVAYPPISPSASLILAARKGFFRDEGLNVTLRETPPSSTIPAVVSGLVQFAFSNTPQVLLARANGLPIKVVVGVAVMGADQDKAYIKLVVHRDSPYRAVSDLNGKTVAVDLLYQLPHFALIRASQAAGADPSTFRFRETPYPAMLDALRSRQVDAVFIIDPFLRAALAEGHRALLPLNYGWDPEAQLTVYVTSERYLQANRDVVRRFQRAMERAGEYAARHEEEIREVLPTFTPTPPEVARQVLLPVYSGRLSRASFADWKELMQRTGALQQDVDIDQLFVEL